MTIYIGSSFDWLTMGLSIIAIIISIINLYQQFWRKKSKLIINIINENNPSAREIPIHFSLSNTGNTSLLLQRIKFGVFQPEYHIIDCGATTMPLDALPVMILPGDTKIFLAYSDHYLPTDPNAKVYYDRHENKTYNIFIQFSIVRAGELIKFRIPYIILHYTKSGARAWGLSPKYDGINIVKDDYIWLRNNIGWFMKKWLKFSKSGWPFRDPYIGRHTPGSFKNFPED